MRGKWLLVSVLLLGLVLGATAVLSLAQTRGSGGSAAPAALAGTAFTYQGRLEKGGSPHTGICDFRFSLHDALSDGSPIGGIQSIEGVPVEDGLFTALVNSGNEFGTGAFNGEARWLAIEVDCGDGSYTLLGPRQALTPSPYALALPGLWTQQNATSPNLIGGYWGNQVAPGVVGASIGGGGQDGYPNRVLADFGTVGGGHDNRADSRSATVGGGAANAVLADYSTVGGGISNTVSGPWATLGGGISNTITLSGTQATVGGGYGNVADGLNSTIGGGQQNSASDVNATVGGGYSNTASGTAATIGGGEVNAASNGWATVAGGQANTASNLNTTVGGGCSNTASGLAATVCGGYGNLADGSNATIGGGQSNRASMVLATVGGGLANTASGLAATVGGGAANSASGDYAAIPGGVYAEASHYGEMAYACGGFEDTIGTAQTSVYVLRGLSTGLSPTDLFLDGSDDRLTIAEGRTVVFDAWVVGRRDTGHSAGYHFSGVIENDSGTTSFVGVPSGETLGEDSAVSWQVWIEADDFVDALQIVVLVGTGETVRFVAYVRTVEVAW